MQLQLFEQEEWRECVAWLTPQCQEITDELAKQERVSVKFGVGSAFTYYVECHHNHRLTPMQFGRKFPLQAVELIREWRRCTPADREAAAPEQQDLTEAAAPQVDDFNYLDYLRLINPPGAPLSDGQLEDFNYKDYTRARRIGGR